MARGTTTGYLGRTGSPDIPESLPGWSRLNDRAFRAIDAEEIALREYAIGWPFRSLRMYERRIDRISSSASSLPTAAFVAGRERRLIGTLTDNSRAGFTGETLPMPLIPIWAGLAGNTLLFALMPALLLLWYRIRTRRARIRQNQCPSCRYPVGQASICTECGHPVPDSISPTTTPTP